MLFTDLPKLKTQLNIDPGDESADAILTMLNTVVSEWIGEYLNRPGFDYKERTEYYNGTGIQKLLLRSRPVYNSPTIQCWVDEAGYFGEATGAFASASALTYGTDFVLKLDGEQDGESRSGILLRISDIWPEPQYRTRGFLTPWIGEGLGTIKVTYTAGYHIDNCPEPIKQAAILLITRLEYLLPQGFELSGDGYEDRNLSFVQERKGYLMSLAAPFLFHYRNWKW